jgi:hypothetical protein
MRRASSSLLGRFLRDDGGGVTVEFVATLPMIWPRSLSCSSSAAGSGTTTS